MEALPVVGSVLGGIFQKDAAETQADATRAAANTAANAANPHLDWQKSEAIPYLTKILRNQQLASSPANKLRTGAVDALLPLLDKLQGMGEPSLFDLKSAPATNAQRLRDVGLNRYTDYVDNPMAQGTYNDREKMAALQMALLTNPQSFLTGPYGAFFDKAGEEAINRSAAAKGQLNSGELLSDLGLFAGKNAMENFQSVLGMLGKLSTQRGIDFTNDQTSAKEGMVAGSALLDDLIKQNTAINATNEGALTGRMKTLADLYNVANASKSDPYFDKLVTLVGGNPAAAAQAITAGNNAAAEMSLGGTAALTNAAKQAIDLWNQSNSGSSSNNNTYYQSQSSNTDGNTIWSNQNLDTGLGLKPPGYTPTYNLNNQF